MKVLEIRQETEFRQLRGDWEVLLASSVSPTIFLTWEWMATWWSVYGNSSDLRILTARDENGILRGIAPLKRQPARRSGQTVQSLAFIGDGSNDSDYLDFIIASGYEDRVMDAFWRQWSEDLRQGVVLTLNEIPDSSPNLPSIKRWAQQQGILYSQTEVPCGTVKLPSTWEEYLHMLRPRFRTKVRSVLRNLESRAEVRFGFCKNADQVERMLPVLFDLHTKRWNQDRKAGVFGWDRKRSFYAAMSSALHERDRLRFSWLEWNGSVLACQIGLEYDGVYFQLQEGYEPASEHWNPGVGLRAWSIREFINRGLREYDFLGGVGRHKADWGCGTKYSSQLIVARTTLKNLVFSKGPQWKENAKEALKTFIPERALAARHARLDRQQQQPASSMESHRADWLRNAAAGCYLHLHLPAVLRPLRDHYQLSISTNGTGRKISWSRRKETAARILCYHRVNDDGDPFFPATPTALFEQAMRFVARHYKVVSLAQLLDCLQNGSSEPVLAITFDDGYQDNYHNAFPILRRYGLPAAIFLSTDGIDSRQPLWFEQLAEALKKAKQEYVDLDPGIPRRFWLRTQEERIASNNQLIALMRGTQDCERRRWLAEILGQLGHADGGERKDKMLQWDQVRLMKSQGIDFGGHTVTHPFISKLPQDQADWEITQCKRRIEEELQCPVDYFAYPNGREEDFGSWNKELVRKAGYRAALTTIWGLNYRSTDPMELRRGGPWEETAALFAYKLDWYQLVNG